MRSRKQLEAAVSTAKGRVDRASALYDLGVFHDNNSRELEAIPCYRKALELGLDPETRARCLAWLASSLHKTGNSEEAAARAAEARLASADPKLQRFLRGLERRIGRRQGACVP